MQGITINLHRFFSRNLHPSKRLFKTFLILLEDLKTEHDIHFCKLRKNLPKHKQLLEQADYFDEDKMQYLRKKVLDMGNDNIRNNDDALEKFTIEFEFNS